MADPTILGTSPVRSASMLPDWTNDGTITAQNGGTVEIQGTLTNFASGVLTGGTWKVFTGSTLLLDTENGSNALTDQRRDRRAQRCRLERLHARSENRGQDRCPGKLQHERHGSQPGRSGRTQPHHTGLLQCRERDRGAGGTFTLAPGADYTQTGGTTTILSPSGLLQSSSSGNFNLQGGTLQGTGRATFAVLNNSGGNSRPGRARPDRNARPHGRLHAGGGGHPRHRPRRRRAGQFGQPAATGVVGRMAPSTSP